MRGQAGNHRFGSWAKSQNLDWPNAHRHGALPIRIVTSITAKAQQESTT